MSLSVYLKLAALVALLIGAAALYAGHRAAIRSALDGAREQLQLEALDKARDEVLEQQTNDLAERAILERQVDALKAQSAALAEERARLTASLAAQQAAGKKLVETGSVDDVVRFGQQLGLHPVKR